MCNQCYWCPHKSSCWQVFTITLLWKGNHTVKQGLPTWEARYTPITPLVLVHLPIPEQGRHWPMADSHVEHKTKPLSQGESNSEVQFKPQNCPRRSNWSESLAEIIFLSGIFLPALSCFSPLVLRVLTRNYVNKNAYLRVCFQENGGRHASLSSNISWGEKVAWECRY